MALARPDENAPVVLDAARQHDAFARDVDRLRKALAGDAEANQELLAAARLASNEARGSASEQVRALGTVHVATTPTDGAAQDAEARETASVRALALRAEADLALIDREIEDLDAQLADVTTPAARSSSSSRSAGSTRPACTAGGRASSARRRSTATGR